MGKFNFEKLRKHTEYTLNYVLTDIVTGEQVTFDVEPTMSDRTHFMELVAKKNAKPSDIVDWFADLALRGEEVSPEEKEIFKDFAMAYYGEIQTQTMIGFKMTTKEELDKRIAEFSEKVVEKNLM